MNELNRFLLRSLVVVPVLWLAQAAASGLPEPSGHVARVAGAAYISSRGYTNAARVGQAIVPGVALSTGEGGELGVILSDGSVLSFGPHSELLLDDYRFAPATDELRLHARLQRGTLNLRTGDIARLAPGAVTLDTPDGAVHVHGGHVLLKVVE